MATVSWGRRERYRFGWCGRLKQPTAPVVAGVYAVTYNQSPDRPKSHTVLLFGEVEDFSKQLPAMKDEVERWWHENGPAEQPELSVFLHPMPGSTKYERDRVRAQLVSEYDPKGND